MKDLAALFLRVLTISAGCSAVLVPLLLLAPRIQKRVAARSFYVLFLLLALRLAVPVEISLPEPAVTVPAPSYTVTVPVAPVRTPVQVQAPAVTPSTVRPAAPAAPVKREIPVTAILGAVWTAGAAACVLWAVASYLLARKRLLARSAPAGAEERALLDALRGELGVKRAVELRRSGNTRSPLALGLFRPVVVLPQQPCAAGELALILRHELTHIRRWDVAYKMALSLACAVNWFNPFVWLMNRAAGRNLELCCDDEVVRGLSVQDRQRYGKVLLDAAETARPLAFSTSFASGKRQLKDRLANLFTEKKNSKILVCAVLAAALLAGGLIACESASGAENPDNDARRKLLETYFYENYEEDTASVVLADLTGDGLDEMIIIQVFDFDTQSTPLALHDGVDLGEFGAASALVCGVVNNEVTTFYSSSIDYSMQGMGSTYLCPQEDGSYALLVRHDDTLHREEQHSYELVCFDETGEAVVLDSMESGVMAGEFRDNIEAYQFSGNPLLVNGTNAFGYWFSFPAQVFDGTDAGVFFGKEGSLFISADPQQTADRRKLLETCFYENYTEDTASVVLADLTGDGLEEMLVITMDTNAAESYWRNSKETYHFSLAVIDCFLVENGNVIPFTNVTEVSSSHAGWGGVYLVPNPAGAGYAILDFRPYVGMGQAEYSYNVYTLGEDGASLNTVDQGSVYFSLDPTSLMGPDTSDDATVEEVEDLLSRVDAYRDSGVPLLVHEETSNGGLEIDYMNTDPADVFSGEIPMEIPYLLSYFMRDGGNLHYDLPQPWPAGPEAAIDQLAATLQGYEEGDYVFRLPNYDGSWNIQISGRMRMEDGDFMSVHYLEGEAWVSGRRYVFETGDGAWFSELTMWVQATGVGGTTAERTFVLVEDGYAGGGGYTYDQLAYIEDYQSSHIENGLYGGTVTLNAAEWVDVPSDRAKELNLTEDDAPGGFYVNDLGLELSFGIAYRKCTVTVLDWENSYQPKTVTVKEFFDILDERGAQNAVIPYTFTISNGGIIAIAERYVP